MRLFPANNSQTYGIMTKGHSTIPHLCCLSAAEIEVAPGVGIPVLILYKGTIAPQIHRYGPAAFGTVWAGSAGTSIFRCSAWGAFSCRFTIMWRLHSDGSVVPQEISGRFHGDFSGFLVGKENALFHFHENPNQERPVGKSVYAVLDNKLFAIQQTRREKMESITLQDLVDDINHLLSQ